MPTPVEIKQSEIIDRLVQARVNNTKIPLDVLTVEQTKQAYQIQSELIKSYLSKSGTTLTGWKVALSGQKAQGKYQLNEPVYGHLTSDMQLQNYACITYDAHEALKVEVELAFALKHDLLPSQHYTDQELISAVEKVIPALEIVNIRWQDWSFDLNQFLADNSAAFAYILGEPFALDITNFSPETLIDDSTHEILRTSTAQDHPTLNYLWLARTLLNREQVLKAGEIILTGSLIQPMNLNDGNYVFEIMGKKLGLDVKKAE